MKKNKASLNKLFLSLFVLFFCIAMAVLINYIGNDSSGNIIKPEIKISICFLICIGAVLFVVSSILPFIMYGRGWMDQNFGYIGEKNVFLIHFPKSNTSSFNPRIEFICYEENNSSESGNSERILWKKKIFPQVESGSNHKGVSIKVPIDIPSESHETDNSNSWSKIQLRLELSPNIGKRFLKSFKFKLGLKNPPTRPNYIQTQPETNSMNSFTNEKMSDFNKTSEQCQSLKEDNFLANLNAVRQSFPSGWKFGLELKLYPRQIIIKKPKKELGMPQFLISFTATIFVMILFLFISGLVIESTNFLLSTIRIITISFGICLAIIEFCIYQYKLYPIKRLIFKTDGVETQKQIFGRIKNIKIPMDQIYNLYFQQAKYAIDHYTLGICYKSGKTVPLLKNKEIMSISYGKDLLKFLNNHWLKPLGRYTDNSK